MNWTELLEAEANTAYRAAEGLMTLVDDGMLEWKPTTGENWMTTGQLLKHLTSACGAACRMFVMGEWGAPEGAEDLPGEGMLPAAEDMPSVENVAAARRALAEDKALALRMIEEAAGRMDEPTPAPWAPDYPLPLGQQLLSMVGHLGNHKAQLYYYLKLQGKPVNTMHLYGMA